MSKLVGLAVAVLALLAMGSGEGYAQATRTWVSGVGDDANPCSRTAPCKTFAGAISKTAAGGEISVLDPGGFGAVTITKSISIVAKGAEGGILASFTNGIIINAAATDEVTLHGLTIEGSGSGLNGVRVLSARAVHISNCLIRGFQGASAGRAIAVESTVATRVHVSDCMLVKNAQGLYVTRPGSGIPSVMLDRVTISDSSLQAVRAAIGVRNVFMSHSVLTGNNIGISLGANANVVSFGNNVIADNTTDGAPTHTLPLQ